MLEQATLLGFPISPWFIGIFICFILIVVGTILLIVDLKNKEIKISENDIKANFKTGFTGSGVMSDTSSVTVADIGMNDNTVADIGVNDETVADIGLGDKTIADIHGNNTDKSVTDIGSRTMCDIDGKQTTYSYEETSDADITQNQNPDTSTEFDCKTSPGGTESLFDSKNAQPVKTTSEENNVYTNKNSADEGKTVSLYD